MSDYMSEGSIELEVADFGPIREANIDLRPLTVFVGPSNTGKSWMATLIYSLHQHLTREARMYRDGLYGLIPSDEHIEKLLTWMKQRAGTKNQGRDLFDSTRKSSGKESFVMPAQFVETAQSIFNDHGTPLTEEMRRCFGANSNSKLIRKGSRNGAHVLIKARPPSGPPPLEHKLVVKSQSTDLKVTVPDGTEIQSDLYFRLRDDYTRFFRIIHDRDSDKDTEIHYLCRRLLSSITVSALPSLFGPLHLPAYYLPADRTGVMQAHSAVVGALIKSTPMAGIRAAARMPLLSGVLADFLEQLIEFGESEFVVTRFSPERAARIEDLLLGGDIHVDKAEITGYPRFSYQPQGWKDKLPLMQASSMVSELAPVVLYLRHRIKNGNVLIIEEPESSLHPAMQVEFIRQLAALVKSGVRVLITTHSEWVLEELANIVQRSRLPSGKRKTLEHEDCALTLDQVGIWLFKKKTRPKGSVVEEMKLDVETGLYPTDYDKISESLYNDSVDIFNRIQDSNE